MARTLPWAMLSVLAVAGWATSLRAERPNIVLIVADDLGWTDLSCYGSEYYQTPSIDSLSAAGMRFTSAYACPNCAPTRAALMSGRYASRTGIYSVNSGARGLEKFRKMIPVENRTELALSEVTIAERLLAAGYDTALIGKWHLGRGAHLPTNQGFATNIGGNDRGAPDADGYFSPYNNPNLRDGPPGEYLTDRLTDEAVRYIETTGDKPFFLYLPYYAVHSPITPKPEKREEWGQRSPSGRHDNPAYAAMIDSLDEGVGRVLDALVRSSLAESTVVMFYSDNGGVGGYGSAGVVFKEITDNAPLRGGKGMLYEGGVRVPFIVRYPGVVEAGTTCDVPIASVDFYPTLLELAGVSDDGEQILDGASFLGLLRGASPGPRPPLFWHFPGYLQGREDIGSWRSRPSGAIRDGDFKLIESFETGALELYNLAEDISEQHNLADVNREKARELRDKLVAWRLATDAPMPRPK